MWLWAQWSAMKNRAAELRYSIIDPPKIEEPANRQVSTHGSIQTKPSYAAHTTVYIYANILASARNEPPWIIMRIFLAYSNSRAIQKRKVENRKIENRHPKDWILKIESIKPSNQKIWIEHKADQIHSTLATSTNIFTPGSLWRAGTAAEQLTNYRDITNKTTMEIKHILSSCSRVIPTTSNGCGQ